MSQSPLQPASPTPAEEQSIPPAETTMAQTALLESPELASPFTQGADRLMDDLFGELEQALSRDTVLPSTPLPNATDAEWIAPPADLPAPAIADPVGTGALMPRLTPRQLVPGEVEPDPDVLLAVNQSTHAPKSRSFDKLLLATLFASLLTTGLLWFWFRDGSRFPRLNNPQPSPAAQKIPLTPEQIEAAQQQQFLTYVDRSLDRIEESAKENRLAQQNQPNQPATAPQTVLERVYVPVYQPPQVIAAQPNVVIQQPTVAGGTSGNPQPAPAPAPATNVPNIAAATSYKLVGVLELGDRSAALFEVNGNPRRIQVGEPIGDSGWTLVSVANQEAIVRRNGEVRSIYVGQQF